MSDTLNVTFNGNDAVECERFIWEVRKHARASGKFWDYSWIAEQVYDAFRGRALYWYLEQPQNVQQDWALLQTELTKMWPLQGDNSREEQASNAPSPAPAAQARVNLSSNTTSTSTKHSMDGKTGRLRSRGGMTCRSDKFLSKHVWTGNQYTHMLGSFILTTNKAEAQTVKLTEVKPGVWRLGLENHPSSRLYIAAFAYSGSYKGPYGILIGADSTSGKPKDSQTTHTGGYYENQEFWTDVWQLKDGRYLTLSGPPDAPGKYKVPLVMQLKFSTELLWFDGTHTNDTAVWTEVEFEFEPEVA